MPSVLDRHREQRAVFFLVFILLLCGCSRLDRKIDAPVEPGPCSEDPQLTSRVIRSLKNTNRSLQSFKGIGRVNFGAGPQAVQSARTVFAGYQAEKLRFEVLGLSGQPITSIAYDGTWFYMTQHSENRFYKKRFPNADLDPLLNIPIPIRTINLILCGQVPMIDPGSARLERDTSDNTYVLLLKSGGWWWRRQEKIYLTDDLKRAWKYEMFKGAGELVYRLEIKALKLYQDYPIPQTIEFMGRDGTTLVLEVLRYWANAEVDPSMFALKPPSK